MADPNTRQGKRTPVTLKIKFKSETLEQFIERYAVDVSQGGIFIRTKEPLAVGTQMRFEFQLRDASPLIGGEGTVVWTRENDPSRPAIAPGMGVRFDRLAEGSQAVLERILAEKAKQAPSRANSETTKPPLFTDTPTRVAPAPIQEALLGKKESDAHTPLPKPVPFHSDAEDFPEEAFEEATKVRALDDLIAATAGDDPGASASNPIAAADAARAAATLTDAPAQAAPAAAAAEPAASATAPGFASARASDPALGDRESSPALPSPPPISPAPAGGEPVKQPRLLDTTPSPRTDPGPGDATDPMEKLAKTKLGLEPVPATRSGGTTAPPPTRPREPSAPRPAVVAAEPSARLPAAKKSSMAPLVILLLVVVAAGGAGLWFFVFRDKAAASSGTTTASGSDPGSAVDPNPGSATATDPGSAGATPGSDAETPSGPLVDTEVAASVPNATVEVVGTDQTGPAPFQAKLEQGKPYKIRVSAPGFATVEQDVTGGDPKLTAKLDPKPRVIHVESTPRGALILVDSRPIGHTTPYDVELTKVQSARKAVRITLSKDGYSSSAKMIDAGDYKEEDARMLASVELALKARPVIRRPPPPPPPTGGSGSDASGDGSGSAGSASGGSGGGSGGTTGGSGGGAGSATTPGGGGAGSSTTPGTGGGAATPPAGGGSATAPSGGGGGATAPRPGSGTSSNKDGAAEPEPSFTNPKP